MNRIDINPTDPVTEVYINGHLQEHVTCLDIQVRPREFPRISIEYNNNEKQRKAGFGEGHEGNA